MISDEKPLQKKWGTWLWGKDNLYAALAGMASATFSERPGSYKSDAVGLTYHSFSKALEEVWAMLCLGFS
jgi:hypothetical protein